MLVHTQKKAKGSVTPNSRILQHKCDKCQMKTILHRYAANSAPDAILLQMHQVLRSPERPLSLDTQVFTRPRFEYDFSQISVHSKSQASIQAKPAVNTPGDIYEREADRIADQVIATPEHIAVGSTLSGIHHISGQPVGQAEAVSVSIDRALSSPSIPLNSVLRQNMERRFGHDFSKVRVHIGATAEQSARDVNAHAFTMGHDIVFGANKFAPGTQEGRRLFAHELTHVVQQASVDNQNGNQILQREQGRGHGTSTSQTPIFQGNNGEAQGTSFYSDPQPSNLGLVAKIYFPTSGTELDSQDRDILRRVINHYGAILQSIIRNRSLNSPSQTSPSPISPLESGVHFEIIGAADWRPAENERLARERARSVMEYLMYNPVSNLGTYRPYFGCYWHGEGAIGTPDDGSTAEELNEFRRVEIITRYRPPEPTPTPAPTSAPAPSVHLRDDYPSEYETDRWLQGYRMGYERAYLGPRSIWTLTRDDINIITICAAQVEPGNIGKRWDPLCGGRAAGIMEGRTDRERGASRYTHFRFVYPPTD